MPVWQYEPKFDRIAVGPNQMNGQPCIRGMRLTVRRVLEAMATYPNRSELLAEYPDLQEEDLQQTLASLPHISMIAWTIQVA
jgi:uncharacterized protein (DUF433 family)